MKSEEDLYIYRNKADSEDSLYFERDGLDNLILEYYYYTHGKRPIIPLIINSNNHLIIRCKSQLSVSFCDEEKIAPSRDVESTYSKYILKITIPKESLLGNDVLVFEPQEEKTYLIYLDKL